MFGVQDGIYNYITFPPYHYILYHPEYDKNGEYAILDKDWEVVARGLWIKKDTYQYGELRAT